MHERREPAARARDGARARSRRPRGDRREPWPPRAAVPHRERASSPWSGRRSASCSRSCSSRRWSRRRRCPCRGWRRRRGGIDPRVLGFAVAVAAAHGAGVRRRAGDADGARRHAAAAEGIGARRRAGRRAAPRAQRARGRRSRPRRHAARRRGAARAQLPAAGSSRIPASDRRRSSPSTSTCRTAIRTSRRSPTSTTSCSRRCAPQPGVSGAGLANFLPLDAGVAPAVPHRGPAASRGPRTRRWLSTRASTRTISE